VGLLNAPLGTNLHKRLTKEGRILDSMTGDNTDFSINFIPKMNKDSLINGYKKVLSTIYAPKHYYERVMRFFKEYVPKRQKGKMRITFSNISAFFKSMFILGIVERERVYYWKLFFWTLFRRPSLFPKAITYTIYGYHFRKIFEAQVEFE
jgi:hypothetical protein